MNSYYMPTRIIADRGALEQLGKEATALGKRALLVSGGQSAKRAGHIDRALQILTHAGVDVTLYDGIAREPELEQVSQGIGLVRDGMCEVVIGLGGGSVMDTAKAIAGLSGLVGTVQEYFDGRAITAPGLPFIAVPTTSGTGAEVTRNAVLTDVTTGLKQSIRDDRWYAKTALIDPELTLSMPPDVTASSGSDALCQAIEAYTSIGASPVTDTLSLHAIRLISRALQTAYVDGGDIAAREDMAYGSLIAGMAMGSAGLGGVHGMAHPLGAKYHIPHGTICGLLLPHVMAHNLAFAQTRYATIGRLFTDASLADEQAAAEHAVVSVSHLVKSVGIPLHLAELGVNQDGFEAIIAESLPSSSLKYNPRPLGHDDVLAILRAAY